MIPEPLHPAVVHFPIVLAVLLPLFAIGTVVAIRPGGVSPRLWLLPFAFSIILALSAWGAVETGEAQEDRVEEIVGEEVIHEHEEAGERFLLLSGILVVITGLGLAPGRSGSVARIAATVGAGALLVVALQVGSSGGELVYEHGAAEAYVDAGSGSGATESATPP